MSIWSSAQEDIRAIDMHADETDQYAGEGPESVVVDVATTGHHDLLRLSLFNVEGAGDLDVCLMLTPDAARRLGATLARAAEQKVHMWPWEPARG